MVTHLELNILEIEVKWALGSINMNFPGFPGSPMVKNPLANAGDARDVHSIPGSGRSPGAVAQSLSLVWPFATPRTAACQVFLSFTISRSLLKLMSIESMMPSNHLVLCCPLLLLPSIFPSIRVFSNESALHIRWPRYWSFSFSISPSNEHSGLISFRIDWFDLFAVQGTLKSLLQHHSLKASIFQCSAFFMVQLVTHSSILAWRIPRTDKPGGLPSMGSQRVRCN